MQYTSTKVEIILGESDVEQNIHCKEANEKTMDCEISVTILFCMF